MSSPNIPTLCSELRDVITDIADDDQKKLLAGKTTPQDVKEALQTLIRGLENNASSNSKARHWLKKTDDIVQMLSPVIDTATALVPHSIGSLIWSSMKIILKIAYSKYQVFEALVDSLIYIADNMPRICLYGEGWPSDIGHNPAHTALAAIVNYLTDASNTIQTKRKILTKGLDLPGLKDAHAKLERTFTSFDFEAIALEFKKLKQRARDNDYRLLLKQLDVNNYEENFLRRRDARLAGTCSWSIESNQKIRDWFHHIAGASRLWITGNPGYGKSILASYLVEKSQEKRTDDELVLYYFCDVRDTATSVLKSLLVQILKSPDRPLYMDDLKNLQDEVSSKHDDYPFSLQEIKKYLGLVSKSFTKLSIIVDGLDECDASRSDATSSTFESVELIHGLCSLPLQQTRILFVSRKEIHIGSALDSWTVVELGEEGTTKDDLRALASAEAEKLKKAISFLAERQDLASEILANADGMFLYIRLLVDSLLKIRAYSCSNIEKLLTQSPKGLDKMYEKYIGTLLERNDYSSPQVEMAIEVLRWLIVVDSPIPLEFICEIIKIKPGDDNFDPKEGLDSFEAALQSALGILVESRDQNIRLVHHTLRDLLRRPRTNLDSNTPDYLRRLYDSTRPEAASAYVFLKSCTILCTSSTIHHFKRMMTPYTPKENVAVASFEVLSVTHSEQYNFEDLWRLKLCDDGTGTSFYWKRLQLRKDISVSELSAVGSSLILHNILLQCCFSASTLTSYAYRSFLVPMTAEHWIHKAFRLDISFALDSFANEQLRMSKCLDKPPSLAHSLWHYFANLAYLPILTWTTNNLHNHIDKYTSLHVPGEYNDDAAVWEMIRAFQLAENDLHRVLFRIRVIKWHRPSPDFNTFRVRAKHVMGIGRRDKFSSHPLRNVDQDFEDSNRPFILYSTEFLPTYPSWFLMTWSLSPIVAFSLPLPLWIILLLGLVSSEGYRYRFHDDDPCQPRRMVRLIFVALLMGRILSRLAGTLSFLLHFLSRFSLFEGHSGSISGLAVFGTIILIGVLYHLDISPSHAKAYGNDKDREARPEENDGYNIDGESLLAKVRQQYASFIRDLKTRPELELFRTSFKGFIEDSDELLEQNDGNSEASLEESDGNSEEQLEGNGGHNTNREMVLAEVQQCFAFIREVRRTEDSKKLLEILKELTGDRTREGYGAFNMVFNMMLAELQQMSPARNTDRERAREIQFTFVSMIRRVIIKMSLDDLQARVSSLEENNGESDEHLKENNGSSEASLEENEGNNKDNEGGLQYIVERPGTKEDARETEANPWKVLRAIRAFFLLCKNACLLRILIDANGLRVENSKTKKTNIRIDPRTYERITVIVAELASMNRAVPFFVAWYGPIPASTLGAANSILNIISMSLALDKIFTFIMDPTGWYHALSILAGLEDRFNNLRSSFESARRSQLEEIKRKWELIQKKSGF